MHPKGRMSFCWPDRTRTTVVGKGILSPRQPVAPTHQASQAVDSNPCALPRIAPSRISLGILSGILRAYPHRHDTNLSGEQHKLCPSHLNRNRRETTSSFLSGTANHTREFRRKTGLGSHGGLGRGKGAPLGNGAAGTSPLTLDSLPRC